MKNKVLLSLVALALVCGALIGIPHLSADSVSAADEVSSVVIPTAAPAKSENTGSYKASAEAKLYPKDDVSLGFSISGVVSDLNAVEGQAVSAGDVLAELKSAENYRRDYAAAELELAQAQDELKDLNDAWSSDKAAAESALIAAKQDLDDKSKAYDEFDTPEYRTRLDNANKTYTEKWNDVEDAKDVLDDVSELSSDSTRRRDAEDEYKRLLQDYNDLKRDYNLLLNDRDRAYADMTEAQSVVDDRQRDVDELKDGPKQSKLEVLNRKVAAAEADMAAAQKGIENCQIIAPFDGTIVSVDVSEGELTVGGKELIVIVDNSEMILKTVDLSETDMPKVSVGSRVTVIFDAYPNNELSGTVTKITNWADKYLGDVVYPVEITLDSTNLPLLWGMTATVTF